MICLSRYISKFYKLNFSKFKILITKKHFSNEEERHLHFSAIKSEFHIKLTNSKEINDLNLLLNKDLAKDLNQNVVFFENLSNFCTALSVASNNNFKIYYENSIILFESIKNKILNNEIKVDSLSKAITILKLFFLLENKKCFNLTREQNDKIFPKIVLQIDKYFNQIEINKCIEIIIMCSYFGITFNPSKIEYKFKMQSKDITFLTILEVK